MNLLVCGKRVKVGRRSRWCHEFFLGNCFWLFESLKVPWHLSVGFGILTGQQQLAVAASHLFPLILLEDSVETKRLWLSDQHQTQLPSEKFKKNSQHRLFHAMYIVQKQSLSFSISLTHTHTQFSHFRLREMFRHHRDHLARKNTATACISPGPVVYMYIRTDNVKLYSIGCIIGECAIRLQRLVRHSQTTRRKAPERKKGARPIPTFSPRHWQPGYLCTYTYKHTFKGLMCISFEKTNKTIAYVMFTYEVDASTGCAMFLCRPLCSCALLSRTERKSFRETI